MAEELGMKLITLIICILFAGSSFARNDWKKEATMLPAVTETVDGFMEVEPEEEAPYAELHEEGEIVKRSKLQKIKVKLVPSYKAKRAQRARRHLRKVRKKYKKAKLAPRGIKRSIVSK